MTENEFSGRYNGTPRCRLCEAEEEITRHHMIPRRFLGRKLQVRIKPSIYGNRCNIIKLCRHCHLGVERNDETYRCRLRDLLNTNELLFLEKQAGREWIDQEYPRSVDLWLA